jgi:dienelactone hydrolase
MRRLLTLLICLGLGVPAVNAADRAAGAADRLRYVLETDAGGDPDDEQSLVRLLLYANELDLEGIIANRPQARNGENLNPERTGLGIVRRLLHAYGECYPNLVRHDPRYPSPEVLHARVVPGYADTEAGVDLLIQAVDREDPRPVWFSNWGTDRGSAPSCLKRALDRVLSERGPAGYARFKSRIRLSSADAFGEHTSRLMPSWSLWVDTFRPELEGRRWYHRFSQIVAKAGGFDLERDVRTGHGPLGALYPTNTTHWMKEGDTMSFLYLIPTGLNNPERPGTGSWAGRYGLREGAAGQAFYWANQQDAWQGTTNRDNMLRRWAEALQNDFRARLDWCVQPPNRANHPPRVLVNQASGTDWIRIRARPGSSLSLDAAGTFDPDGQSLRFDWFGYPEAGTCSEVVVLDTPRAAATTVRLPAKAAGQEVHVVLAVTDTGEPPLTRYRRIVITLEPESEPGPELMQYARPPAEFANRFGNYAPLLPGLPGSVDIAAEQWASRRKELLNQWHGLMGPWPDLLERPRLESLSERRDAGLVWRRVRLEVAPEQLQEGWLLRPEGSGPFPAVLVVFYEPETSVGRGKEPLRDFGLRLARRGFVTLSIGTPGGNAWKPDLGNAQCQPLSFHAYVAANCWRALAHLPEVDSSRIGIVGHSYGGKWAMFAGALWEPFAAVAVSDPGIVFDETRPNVNYWEPWYLGMDSREKRPKAGVPTAENPRTGAYRRLREEGRDLHEIQALIAPRPFLVSGGSEDPPERWLALNHLVALNQSLSHTNRVFMSNRPAHDPTEDSNALIDAFFAHFLGPGK